MRYAVLQAVPGLVVNAIDGPDDYAHPDDGVILVPSETAHAGDHYNGTTFVPQEPLQQERGPADLLRYAEEIAARILSVPTPFNVAAPLEPPILVLCAASDAVTIDLGEWWRYGVVTPTGRRTWVDALGTATDLTGAQCVVLATASGTWRAAVKALLATTAARIAAGALTSVGEIDALPWPRGA